MPNFITDGTTSYGSISGDVFPKTDAVPVVGPANKSIAAVDWNIDNQALLDIKTWLNSPTWIAINPVTPDPAPSGKGGNSQPGYFWIDPSLNIRATVNSNSFPIFSGQNITFDKEQGGHLIIASDSTTNGVVGDGIAISAANGTGTGADGGIISISAGTGDRNGGRLTIAAGIGGSGVGGESHFKGGDSTSSYGGDVYLSGGTEPTSAKTGSAYITGLEITIASGRDTVLPRPTVILPNPGSVSNLATLAVLGEPIAGHNATLTNPMAIKVLRGLSSFSNVQTQDLTVNGFVGFYGTSPIAKQISGADLTNNVTFGGVNDQIDDIVTGGTVGTDIRDALYQLARKVKQLNDALRAYGLFT